MQKEIDFVVNEADKKLLYVWIFLITSMMTTEFSIAI